MGGFHRQRFLGKTPPQLGCGFKRKEKYRQFLHIPYSY